MLPLISMYSEMLYIERAVSACCAIQISRCAREIANPESQPAGKTFERITRLFYPMRALILSWPLPFRHLPLFSYRVCSRQKPAVLPDTPGGLSAGTPAA